MGGNIHSRVAHSYDSVSFLLAYSFTGIGFLRRKARGTETKEIRWLSYAEIDDS